MHNQIQFIAQNKMKNRPCLYVKIHQFMAYYMSRIACAKYNLVPFDTLQPLGAWSGNPPPFALRLSGSWGIINRMCPYLACASRMFSIRWNLL